MTDALGATNAVNGETVGDTPSTATKRVEGTRRSEYLQTSMDLPMPSRAWPSLRAVLEAAITTRAPRDVIVNCYGEADPDGWWWSVDAGVGCRVDSLLVLVSEESVVHVTKKWPVLGGQFGGTPG